MATHHHGTTAEVRALNAFITLQRAAESVAAQTQRHLADAGLTPSQFAALEALYHLGPLCQRDLGAKLLRTSGNMTMVVDNLVKRDMVKRVPDPEDRRRVSVHLTAPGRRLIRKVLRPHIAGIVETLSVLSAGEQDTLRRVCRRLGRGAAERHTA